MFSISKLFGSRLPQVEREIFRFFDGCGDPEQGPNRAVDPMVVLRSLQTDEEFVIDKDPELALTGDQDAVERTVKVVRKAFGVVGFSRCDNTGTETGLTEGETIALLDEFGLWMEGLKKKWQPVADFVACYGGGADERDYERWFGLFLNLRRSHLRQSVGFLEALQTAAHEQGWDLKWFESLADDEKEAAAQHEVNQALHEAATWQLH